MCCFRFTITTHYRKEVEQQLKIAQQLGNLHQIKYLLAILAVMAAILGLEIWASGVSFADATQL